MNKEDKKITLEKLDLSRRKKNWYSDKVLEIFEEMNFSDWQEEAINALRQRKVLDFTVIPGKVRAKVVDNNGKLTKAEIFLPEFGNEYWNKIFEKLSEQSFFLAKLLAGAMPIEVEDAFNEMGDPLFPKTANQFKIKINDAVVTELNTQAASMVQRFSEKISENPFLIFILRGREYEETMLELKRRRATLKTKYEVESAISYQEIDYTPAPPLISTLDRFWNMSPEINELSYNIIADELPAALLKRLDSLPLGGLEDEVDHQIEEAYVQIARRAQAYGLGVDWKNEDSASLKLRRIDKDLD